uniref:Heading date 5 n=1 Tax=Oryza sativa subsp. japonica TaxID=39947 RepID=Q05KQ0_ORYSJ|nr:imperfect Hd5 protein [Oryza sativa Japonica Group]BAL45948.1 heading date 5 [Oryza sativa Japonica Group]
MKSRKSYGHLLSPVGSPPLDNESGEAAAAAAGAAPGMSSTAAAAVGTRRRRSRTGSCRSRT